MAPPLPFTVSPAQWKTRDATALSGFGRTEVSGEGGRVAGRRPLIAALMGLSGSDDVNAREGEEEITSKVPTGCLRGTSGKTCDVMSARRKLLLPCAPCVGLNMAGYLGCRLVRASEEGATEHYYKGRTPWSQCTDKELRCFCI